MTRSSAFSIRAGVSPAFYGAVREQVNALAKYLQRELAVKPIWNSHGSRKCNAFT